MAKKEKEEEIREYTPTGEERTYFERLRRQQRELVMRELEKERLEVERRVAEEERKLEEAKAALISARQSRILRRILLIILLVLVFVFLYLGWHCQWKVECIKGILGLG
jgi:cytochrome c-type biogenesis protein CcmH/NrfG